MSICTGCHADLGEGSPPAHQCNHCGPVPCATCGGTNDLATGESCPCWVSFEGLPLADIKGLLAGLDLSLEHE